MENQPKKSPSESWNEFENIAKNTIISAESSINQLNHLVKVGRDIKEYCEKGATFELFAEGTILLADNTVKQMKMVMKEGKDLFITQGNCAEGAGDTKNQDGNYYQADFFGEIAAGYRTEKDGLSNCNNLTQEDDAMAFDFSMLGSNNEKELDSLFGHDGTSQEDYTAKLDPSFDRFVGKQTCCNIIFNQEVSWRKHIANRHTPVSCNICHTTFSRKTKLYIHISAKHKGESYLYQCDYCEFESINLNELTSHKKKDHMANDLPKVFNEKQSILICLTCGKKYDSKSESNMNSYKRHLRTHLPKVLPQTKVVLSCERCGKSYDNNGSYRRHLKTHLQKTTSEVFTCNVCGKSYNNSRSQRRHLHTHMTDIGKKSGCNENVGFVPSFVLKYSLVD